MPALAKFVNAHVYLRISLTENEAGRYIAVKIEIIWAEELGIGMYISNTTHLHSSGILDIDGGISLKGLQHQNFNLLIYSITNLVNGIFYAVVKKGPERFQAIDFRDQHIAFTLQQIRRVRDFFAGSRHQFILWHFCVLNKLDTGLKVLEHGIMMLPKMSSDVKHAKAEAHTSRCDRIMCISLLKFMSWFCTTCAS